jgi:antitoxin CptB
MDINRVRWGSRRGMLELDLILLPFVEKFYADLPAEDQTLFVELLECEDQDLFAWFLHRQQPDDPKLCRMIDIIRESRHGNPHH